LAAVLPRMLGFQNEITVSVQNVMKKHGNYNIRGRPVVQNSIQRSFAPISIARRRAELYSAFAREVTRLSGRRLG
jgi:hypothetical protein